jgi:phage gp45-like
MSDATDNLIVRARTTKTKDGETQQTVEAEGRANEQIGGPKHGAPRQQGYPLTSHLPNGSIGLMLMPGGDPSQAVMIFGEHPDHRPKDLGEGEWKLYDKWGKHLHATENGWTMTVGKLTIVADTVVIQSADINLGGLGGKPVAVEGTIDSAGHPLVSNFCTTVKAV